MEQLFSLFFLGDVSWMPPTSGQIIMVGLRNPTKNMPANKSHNNKGHWLSITLATLIFEHDYVVTIWNEFFFKILLLCDK